MVEFGRCPRVSCQGQPVLPVGLSDLPRTNTVKLFCPKCQDIFHPKQTRHANIDGAYFGTTFPHLLLQSHPELVPTKSTQPYVPKIFGFKIHKSSAYYPKSPAINNAINENENVNGNTNTNATVTGNLTVNGLQNIEKIVKR